MSTTIHDGGQVIHDPDDLTVYTMDWGSRLATGAEIATSTWAVEDAPDAVLTLDQPAILAGNRSTRVRVSAGTTNASYKVTNQIITNESPTQKWTASFYVKVRER